MSECILVVDDDREIVRGNRNTFGKGGISGIKSV